MVTSESTDDMRTRAAAAWIAIPSVLLVGLNVVVVARFGTALIVGIATLPLWCRDVIENRVARIAVLAGVACLIAGSLLTLRVPLGREFNSLNSRYVVMLIATCLCSLGVLLWARRQVGTNMVILTYGVGLLVHNVAFTGSPLGGNYWKHQLAVPLTLIVVSLVARVSPVRGPILALLCLSAVGAANDARSYLGMCLLTILLLAWSTRTLTSNRRKSRVRAIVFLAAAVGALYLILSSLLLSGAFGDAAQARSQSQVEQGGSLILGGRPEWAATEALMRHFPMGFGLGAVPRFEEIQTAKEAMATVGQGGPNGYIDFYMFGGHFELHSAVGDLWAWFGLVGAAFALWLTWQLALSIVNRPHEPDSRAAVVFSAVLGLWYVWFGPANLNLMFIVFALAVSVPLSPGPTLNSPAPAWSPTGEPLRV